MIFIYSLLIIFSFLVCIAILLFFLAEFIAIFTTDAPFVPIPNIENKIIENLNLQNNSVLYDLGCGDGRVLKTVSEKYPEIKAVGVEKAFFPYLIAKWKTRKNKNIEIRREDIFETDVSEATHIFIYLYPEVVKKLMPVLEKKCKTGTVVMSCDFEDSDRAPEKIIKLEPNGTERGNRLIIYRL